MNDSILTTIKLMLGIGEEYAHFDEQLIRHINSIFLTLNQLGVGTEKVFKITGDAETWFDFLGETDDYDTVITYIYRKVKVDFDPPTSSFVLDAMERRSKEDEWRLNLQAEMEALNDGTET